MNCFKCATPLPDGSRFCLSCGADVSGDAAVRTSASLTRAEVDELLVRLRAEAGAEYHVHKELGRGGMAAVFLATEVALNRKVAIKVLPPELTYGQGLVDRFIREAQTAAALDHPHIIPIYRVSSSGKLFWYAMKYVEGIDLSDRIKERGFLPGEEAVALLQPTASALDYAHARKVVHRDVKPANVMLAEGDWVYVTDFGIAKALGGSSLTSSGAAIGTPFYMSPEQCLGGMVSAQSDQYALAVMAYEMLSGHLPFDGESAVEILTKHCTQEAPPLEVLVPSLPKAVTAVVQRGMAKEPEQRFHSSLAFVRALKDAVEGRGVSGPTPVRSTRPRTRPGDRTRPGGNGRRWVIFGGILVALGGAAWLAQERWGVLSSLEAMAGLVPPTGPAAVAADSTAPPVPSARIHVTTRPKDARVKVGDSVVVGDSITLPLGSQTIQVSAPGYRDTTFSVELARRDEVKEFVVQLKPIPKPPRDTTPPPPAFGLVWANTLPRSYVSIDGVPAGQTPLRRHPLSVGKHTLHFHADGEKDYDTTLVIRARDSLAVPFIQLTADSSP